MLVDEAVIRPFEQWAADGMTSDPFQVARLIHWEKIIGQIQIQHYDFQVVKRKPWNIDAAAAIILLARSLKELNLSMAK